VILVLVLGYIWLFGAVYFAFKDFDIRMKKLEQYVMEVQNDTPPNADA